LKDDENIFLLLASASRAPDTPGWLFLFALFITFRHLK
jgi:hypothetical protein